MDPAANLIIATAGPGRDWSGMETLTMCIFGGPKPQPIPEPPPPPVVPTRDDPEVNAAAASKRRRQLAMKGRKSTILTGSLGDQSDVNTGKKTLLGA